MTKTANGMQVINHNGATYRTRWPAQMFQAFRNLDLDEQNRPQVSDRVTCPHCANLGSVALDAYSCDVVACPMCQVGRLHNVSWRARLSFDDRNKPIVSSQPISDWCWRPSDDPSAYSWNKGLSIDHTTRCSSCKQRAAIPGTVCIACRSYNHTNNREPNL